MNTLLAMRAKLEAEGYQVAVHLLAPGTIFGEHCTCQARIDVVLSGQLRLVIGGEVHLLGPGDWIRVPVGTLVTAEVVGDEPVLGLDAA